MDWVVGNTYYLSNRDECEGEEPQRWEILLTESRTNGFWTTWTDLNVNQIYPRVSYSIESLDSLAERWEITCKPVVKYGRSDCM